jgi:hypothetical protein
VERSREGGVIAPRQARFVVGMSKSRSVTPVCIVHRIFNAKCFQTESAVSVVYRQDEARSLSR